MLVAVNDHLEEWINMDAATTNNFSHVYGMNYPDVSIFAVPFSYCCKIDYNTITEMMMFYRRHISKDKVHHGTRG
jgi:hypothetical protein